MIRLLNLLLIMTGWSNIAIAFDYFDSDIDYWQERDMAKARTEKGSSDISPTAPSKTNFDWGKHLDPKNDEFFREGAYIPPAPFMELVRNPTVQNIRYWFGFIEKRNHLAARLHKRMQEYVSENKSQLNGETGNAIATKTSQPRNGDADDSRYRFRLYFHSACPHCKRMMQTMRDLQDQGYAVEVAQIDYNRQATQEFSIPVRQADQLELEEKQITSWPVLLVGDVERKIVYRINGYQSTADVLNTIRRRS